jgi:predicted nucleic acid-binding protein
VRFWDSSALVPLLVREPTSRWALAIFEADPDVIAWWASPVECASALARLERDGVLTQTAMAEALVRLDGLMAAWNELQPSDRVRSSAVRLLRTHAMRAGDALQLAAAIAAAEDHPASVSVVTLDDRLAEAADREGFVVVRPAASPPRKARARPGKPA